MGSRFKIALVSNRFPYGHGEEFIFSEVEQWSGDPRFELIIAPFFKEGALRKTPPGISITDELCISKWRSARLIFCSMLGRKVVVYAKFLFDLLLKRISISEKISILKRFVQSDVVATLLDRFQSSKNFDCVYFYWADLGPLGLLRAEKFDANVFKLARAHGYDLYEDRVSFGYVPFKQASLSTLDQVHCISEEGVNYAHSQFGIPHRKLVLSRLGVKLPERRPPTRGSNYFEVVSCSIVRDIKRIHLIIDAVAIASVGVSKPIRWTHIGSGPLFERIEKYARQKLSGIGVKFEFHGQLSNDQVQNLYATRHFDCFLNFSAHEGVPVTIMEAQAYGIPAIAPDVGGVSTLFDGSQWLLMKKEAVAADMASRLQRISQLDQAEQEICRSEVFVSTQRKFSAQVNNKKFRDHVYSEVSKRKKVDKPVDRLEITNE